ncbi:putative Holliday junction resolvase [Caloramator mitchellensis]|uniref:Putative pre-16S rRNA nuclease n=1 Tax=Caloramator mitchellensis TaxID=908809 RepID=A0A0R3JTR2_CALMK|nr:Holliday junction resolvase RuvX [Caloramator mitchellensis]KRQ86872.1 putative Holliday junction resolvase [Caloramator mitchellensis]
MRILGLDIGEKRIGIALSDPLGWTAQSLKTLERRGIKSDLMEIIKIINEHNIEKIVVGLPKNMNGSLGPASEKVMRFCEKLKEKTDKEIVFEDERLTTMQAERILIDADMSRKKRKGVIDSVAATFILQSYLDRNRKI